MRRSDPRFKNLFDCMNSISVLEVRLLSFDGSLFCASEQAAKALSYPWSYRAFYSFELLRSCRPISATDQPWQVRRIHTFHGSSRIYLYVLKVARLSIIGRAAHLNRVWPPEMS